MEPIFRNVVRFAQRRGTFCSDAQLRWLFLSILCIGLVFSLHASGRQRSTVGAGNTHTRVMTISTSMPLTVVPAVEISRRATDSTANRRDDAAGSRNGKRAPRAAKRLRAYTEDQVQDLIRTYAESFGLNPEIPLAIARCESQFQWNAANRGSTARGVFQYVARTWRHTPEGKRGTSALDADANIRMALTHMATVGTTTPWRASRACWSEGRSGVSLARAVAPESSIDDAAPEAAPTSGSQSDVAADTVSTDD